MINEKEFDIIAKVFKKYFEIEKIPTDELSHAEYIEFDINKIKQKLREKEILQKSAFEEFHEYFKKLPLMPIELANKINVFYNLALEAIEEAKNENK